MKPESSHKINVLIVDDEALLREGLRSMLEKEIFIGKVIEASDADEFSRQLEANTVNVILMDIRLRKSSGLELIKHLKTAEHPAKVIAVTGLDGVELILNLLKLGVHGIVYKLDGYGEIVKSIRNVNQAGSYFPENILKIIQTNAHRWEELPSVMLSFSEKELLKAIANGDTTKEIALNLKMSPATAETYRIRLMKKVGVSNTAALLAYAFRNGIL
jgi:DNA-binding NarL/FixJ family response regulator